MTSTVKLAKNLLEVLPDPVSLIESMRAVGYTVEAAVADVVDNSISAAAKKVTIQYDASEDPYVVILDDGVGMSATEVTEAMRHGRNPMEQRAANDLGRFGLGLKTASLSQCRRLTVVSKKNKIVSARAWDLDVVEKTGRWVIVVPDQEELERLPLFHELSDLKTGTLVVWQELDRLIAGSHRPQAEMTQKFRAMEAHLALVFHRFKYKEGSNRAVEIWLNGKPLPARDPFLKENHFRQPLEGQKIKHPKGVVVVTPYVLPPISHLTEEEIDLAGGADGLRTSQGFYIYRARRLVIWGTWFRLVPKEEFFKLSRVQVDIPNSFDELWSLDIKKSAAFPPDVIRERLREITPYFVNKSKQTVTYRGRQTEASSTHPVWSRTETTNNSFQYSLNREHPIHIKIGSMLEKKGLRNYELMLRLVESALPLEAIYADMCSDKNERSSTPLNEAVEMAKNMIELLGFDIDTALSIEPLVSQPKLHQKIRDEAKKWQQ